MKSAYTRLRIYRGAIGLIAAAVGAGCKGDTFYPAVVSLSIATTVKDSVTGSLVPNAILVAKMGATTTDSVAIGPNVAMYPVSLAQMAGTYVITVQAPGYRTWTTQATVTSTNTCGTLSPLSITALMQKAP